MSRQDRPTLRALLERDEPLVSPGVYDCISARIVQRSGFDCAFISGASVTASILGLPDVGLESMSEVLAQARNIARSVEIPVIVDAGAGYGNAINVTRAVDEFERAGLAGIFIEDQVFPPRCGHFEGIQVVGADEMVVKIRAARLARRERDFIIIARTDARSVYGLDDAIDRATRYRDAGADVIFVEGLHDVEELRQVGQRAPKPLQANIADDGASLALPVAQLFELGFKLISYSGTLQRGAIRAMQDALAVLRAQGSTNGLVPQGVASLAERSELLDLATYRRLEQELYSNAPATDGVNASDVRTPA